MLVGCLMSRRENRKPYSNTYSHKAKNNSHKSMFRTCLFCQLTTHFPRYSLKSKPMLLQRDLFWNGLITPVPTFSREHVHHPCTLRGRGVCIHGARTAAFQSRFSALVFT